MLRASVIAEKLGIRTVSVVCSDFSALAEATADAFGMKGLPLVHYPGVMATDSATVLQTKFKTLAQEIVAMLGQAREVGSTASEPIAAPDVTIFSGTLGAVQDHFLRAGWSDGLPIIPPTVSCVREFLRFTDRDPNEVIAILPAENREATVWNTAVIGVMAGCRPEYMPLLLAIVEAIADPGFRLQDAGSTPGWEPLVIVSGPIIDDLQFNFGTGVMRVGRQANSSVGRFLRLYMRNVAGFRFPPGRTDKGAIGMNFNVALAENEAAVRQMGWPTFAEERGFAPGESVATVQSVIAISMPIYSSGDEPYPHLDRLVEIFGTLASNWTYVGGLRFGAFHPLILLSAAVAKVLSRAGLTKTDVRDYLHSRALVSVEAMGHGHSMPVQLDELVANGTAPAIYGGRAPSDLVPVFPWRDSIGIVVAGDPDRTQSKGFLQNHHQGVPISKAIRLPANWAARTR